MENKQDIIENLSQFNNLSFTKKQWEIILKGCNCPKSCHFWRALRDNNLQKVGKLFILTDITSKSFEIVWNTYCKLNRTGAKKTYDKKKARKKVEEVNRKGTIFYLVNGYLTTNPAENYD